jgi:hypothetical protein
MNRNKIIVVCLIISLLVNTFLLKNYFDGHSNQIELEKAILMNEYSERAKEWLKFTSFLKTLLRIDDKHFPISEEQSRLYGILATPAEPVYIPKVTHNIRADYELYNDYSRFIIEFDREYAAIVNRFKSKSPLMDKDQLLALINRLDETYDLFMDKAVGDWRVSRTGKKFDIRFEPQKEILDEVIQELMLIHEELEAIE